jgi:hypothetical protein
VKHVSTLLLSWSTLVYGNSVGCGVSVVGFAGVGLASSFRMNCPLGMRQWNIIFGFLVLDFLETLKFIELALQGRFIF